MFVILVVDIVGIGKYLIKLRINMFIRHKNKKYIM